MKKKHYIIKLWLNEKHYAKWDILAKDNIEAQYTCEHLKECCRKNGKWNPIRADILFG